MRIFKSLILLASALAIGVAPACDSSGGTSVPITDTTGGGDTTAADTTGGGGDTSVAQDTMVPDIPDTPGTVKALQGEAEANGCDPTGIVTVNPQASLTAVVVTSPKYDALTPDNNVTADALDGYYVADQDGGLWSGLNISISRAEGTDFQPGTVLDLEGELLEFYCNTQLKVTSFLEGGAIDPPAPLEVEPTDIGNEAYEGMLVKVSDVTVTEEVGGGVYRVTGGFLVDHEFDFFLQMEQGKTYDVTGEVKYAFNEWRLMPRTAADVFDKTPGTATTIKDIQSSAASLTGCADSSYFDDGLEITGVVASDAFTVSGKSAFYLSDGTQDPYSGVLIYDKNGVAAGVSMGDVVTLTGQHQEFYCLTEFVPSAMQPATDTTIAAPAPVALTNDLTPEDLEKYEGMLVTLSNVSVINVTQYNESETDAGVLIDKYIMGDAFTAPAAGTTLSSVTGFLNYGFGNYRVSPRSAADMVVAN